MLLRKTLAVLAVCIGFGSLSQANAGPALPDLNTVPTAYMRHFHHYGRHHIVYRPHYRYRVVRHYRPYRYGYYRRAYHPYRYGYYRRYHRPYRYGYYRPYRYGYYRRHYPGVGYYGAPYYRPHRGVSFSIGF